MRKSMITGSDTPGDTSALGPWLNIEQIASAELSSEDPQHPFEQALRDGITGGWRASSPGPQLLRLRFDSPQSIRRIHLAFREELVDRAQEIALFSTSKTYSRKELVRQQWAFSRSGSTTEVEDYFFDLKEVTILDLQIDPGRHDKTVFASLQSFQIG